MRRAICIATVVWLLSAAFTSAKIALAESARDTARPRRSRDANLPLERGMLLVARRQVGGYFAETVVLIVDYSEEGAMGLILNRPTATPLERLLAGDQETGTWDDVVYRGGPVSSASLSILIRAASPPANTSPVFSDIHVGHQASILRSAVEAGATPQQVRAYFGYAGWSPGQLDFEIERGDWRVVPAVPDGVFAKQTAKMWGDLIFKYDGLQVRAPAGSVRG